VPSLGGGCCLWVSARRSGTEQRRLCAVVGQAGVAVRVRQDRGVSAALFSPPAPPANVSIFVSTVPSGRVGFLCAEPPGVRGDQDVALGLVFGPRLLCKTGWCRRFCVRAILRGWSWGDNVPLGRTRLDVLFVLAPLQGSPCWRGSRDSGALALVFSPRECA